MADMRGNFEELQIEIFGESHAEEIGVRLGGLPCGLELTLSGVNAMLERRRSRKGVWSTPRTESDEPIIVGGLKKTENGYAVDGVVDIRIKNTNVRPADYSNIEAIPRPSHADYVSYVRDGKISSGGGRFSGRLTAPLCVAGGIAIELLEELGVHICAYLASVGGVNGKSYKTLSEIAISGVSEEDEKRIKGSDFPLLDESARETMEEEIRSAAADGDSVGGVVECVVSGLKAGEFGDALFEGLEGKISYSIFAIPAVRGVEFGSGFDLSMGRGSEANDAFTAKNGEVKTLTNNSGGVNGGLCNGMPLTLRVGFRPTPSISKPQRSVDLNSMTERELEIKGRHDSCIAVRAVPCVESAVAIALLDEVLKRRKGIALYNK